MSMTMLKAMIAAGFVFAATPVLAADEISASYDISFGGARIMKANYSAIFNEGVYSAALDAKTVGVSKWLSKIKLNLNASGKLGKSDVTPTSYNYSRKKNDKRKERSLSFAPNGDLVTKGTDYGDAILNAMSSSVMDPLSMLLKLSRAKSPCSGKHRAFDGRDVFDITLSSGGKTETSVTCKATYTPVAGGEVEDGDTDPKYYEITLVPMAGVEGYIPVRIAGTSKGVGFDVSATSVSVNGSPLAY
jgi:Protein of unknown function (DUF3108)